MIPSDRDIFKDVNGLKKEKELEKKINYDDLNYSVYSTNKRVNFSEIKTGRFSKKL